MMTAMMMQIFKYRTLFPPNSSLTPHRRLTDWRMSHSLPDERKRNTSMISPPSLPLPSIHHISFFQSLFPFPPSHFFLFLLPHEKDPTGQPKKVKGEKRGKISNRCCFGGGNAKIKNMEKKKKRDMLYMQNAVETRLNEKGKSPNPMTKEM